MDNKVIAERLRNLREIKGVSVVEVAKACGITPQALCMYEAGKRIPRDEIKKRIASYYKKTVNAIFFAD